MPKVAIVADQMVGLGGGERVVEALAQAFPDAPIYTPIYDPKRAPSSVQRRVITSWLQHLPAGSLYAKALLPFYPSAIESFDLSAFDVIVSSNHTLAKGVLRSAEQLSICYCHTPLRVIWERPHSDLRRAPAIFHVFLRPLFSWLRLWDLAAAARVDQFVANSKTTQNRISAHYRRSSLIVTPPIDVEGFHPGGEVGDYFLVVARNVPYKRTDLAIEAAQRLGRRLVVVGEGTERLSGTGGPVTALGKVRQSQLVALMRGARALLSPQIEDFGMAILEMNACGRPAIALARGGALETLVDGKTGLLFQEQTVESLSEAMLRFESIRFEPSEIRRHAERFSKERFILVMRELVADLYRAKGLENGRISNATRVLAS